MTHYIYIYRDKPIPNARKSQESKKLCTGKRAGEGAGARKKDVMQNVAGKIRWKESI
jgi:hypothetical protein